MIVCPNCRREFASAGLYCPWCGAPLVKGLPELRQVQEAALPVQETRAQVSAPAYYPPAYPPPPHSHRRYRIVIIALSLTVLVLTAMLTETVLVPEFATPSSSRNPYTIVNERESQNWSGFVVYGNDSVIFDVKAKWVVPSLHCSSSNTSDHWSAVWVGMDGALSTSHTVEQVGTIQKCPERSATGQYFAVIEWYPARGYRSLHAMIPGDLVSAEVAWDGEKFTASISDLTIGWSFSDTNSTIGTIASKSSAEWIVEAPTSFTTGQVLPLADFDKVFLSDCRVTRGTAARPMGDFPLVQDTMVDVNATVKARPVLPLYNDGTQFSVLWRSAGP